MSFLGLDPARNLSFYTVPSIMIVGFASHMYGGLMCGKAFDPANPRGWKENLAKSEDIDKETKQRITRAKAASDNVFETLGFYAGGVLAANYAGVPTSTINNLTLGCLGLRAAFSVWYIWIQANRNLAGIRSLLWIAYMGMTVTLWVKAGNRLA